MLDLGSGNRHAREARQPHIERELLAPLREAGIAIFHADLQAGEGVDLAGNILDPAVRAALKAEAFSLVLVANMLEHVDDRPAVIAACEDIAGPGGLILASVPMSYPYHADPIDTGYRPSPVELAAAFPHGQVLLAETIAGPTYADEMKSGGRKAWREAVRTLAWLLVGVARPRSAAAKVHRWLWYSRPYRTAVALIAVSRVGPGRA